MVIAVEAISDKIWSEKLAAISKKVHQYTSPSVAAGRGAVEQAYTSVGLFFCHDFCLQGDFWLHFAQVDLYKQSFASNSTQGGITYGQVLEIYSG